jgi:hypothetical protein
VLKASLSAYTCCTLETVNALIIADPATAGTVQSDEAAAVCGLLGPTGGMHAFY